MALLSSTLTRGAVVVRNSVLFFTGRRTLISHIVAVTPGTLNPEDGHKLSDLEIMSHASCI